MLPCAARSIINLETLTLPACADVHSLTTPQSTSVVPVLVVQDRSQSQSQTEEALRLAQTYGGKEPHGA